MMTLDSAQKDKTDTDTLDKDFSRHQMELNASLQQHYEGMENRFNRLESLLHQQRSIEESNQRRPQQKNAGFRAASGDAHIEAIQIRVSQYSTACCRNWCPCDCHSQKKVSLLGITEIVLGRMFLGYAGLPLWNKKCNFPGCKRRQNPSLTVDYWFPWWFLAMNVKMLLNYEPNLGPRLQIATLRRIPDSAQSIKFAFEGNVDGLQHLFKQGLASFQDVSDSRGYTLLGVSSQ